MIHVHFWWLMGLPIGFGFGMWRDGLRASGGLMMGVSGASMILMIAYGI